MRVKSKMRKMLKLKPEGNKYYIHKLKLRATICSLQEKRDVELLNL